MARQTNAVFWISGSFYGQLIEHLGREISPLQGLYLHRKTQEGSRYTSVAVTKQRSGVGAVATVIGLPKKI
jgi:hypothetical protein